MSFLIVRKYGKELRRFSFQGDIITIGREILEAHGGPDLPLTDSSRKVSRYHAALVRDRRGFYFLRDLGSANGTFVNGRLIYGKRLHEKDRISIGDFELLYSGRENVPPDLSQAIRVINSTPHSQRGSERTAPDNIEDVGEGISETGKQVLHDIQNRIRSLPDGSGIHEEILNCAIPAVGARRGFIAGIEMPFAVVPEAVYGLDTDQGEQISVSVDFINRVIAGTGVLVEYFAGVAVMGSPLPVRTGKMGVIYLECDHGRSFSEADRAFLGQLCERVQSTIIQKTMNVAGMINDSPERFDWNADLVAKCPEMKDVMVEFDLSADPTGHVLLRGETGTGKEVSAQAIHARSTRATGPFIAVELSNLENEMVPGTLFGWIKGGFDGADRDAKGAFEHADGGTIYLDEVGDISGKIQVQLERVLDKKEVTPVGSATSVGVDVKIIAATGVDPERTATENSRSGDLLQRFGKQIMLPPLRERRADIPLLVCFFIDQSDSPLRAVSHGAMRLLQQYEWPGNVRELRDVIKEVAAKGKEIIFGFDLPVRIQHSRQNTGDTGYTTIQDTEKLEIVKVLRKVNWDKSRAWKLLGYGSKQTLYNKIKKYEIKMPAGVVSEED